MTDWLNKAGPPRWPVGRMKDWIRVVNGYPFDASLFSSETGTPLIRIRDLLTERTETYVEGPIPPIAEVRDGDFLIGMDGDFNAVRWTGGAAALNQRLCRVVAQGRLEQRFFEYVARIALAFINDLTYATTVKHLSARDLGDQPIPLPPVVEQQRIADYLDTETARTDSLIAKRKRMVALLAERRAGIIESTIRDLSNTWGERGLRFVAPEILVGIVVTPAAFYAEKGVLALRGTNVKPGHLDLTDTVTLSDDGHALHRKSILRAGDVVVVRTGQAGAACVVPPELDGANCIDVLIVRKSQTLDPSFLEYVLNSDWATKHIAEHSVGTIQSHFNVGALKQLPIPVPPIEVQADVAKDLARAVARVDRLQQMTQRQIDLLVEHRQALITAVVTGERETPGVAA